MADGATRTWRAGEDTRTTTRWSDEERAWLEGRAAAAGHGKVGTVVRELVQAAMRAVPADAGEVRARFTRDMRDLTGAPRRVPGAAAPSSPSGAAAPPRASRVKLEVVVARRLAGSGGPIPPARLADARRMVKAGRARVAGVPCADPNMLVIPTQVEVGE